MAFGKNLYITMNVLLKRNGNTLGALARQRKRNVLNPISFDLLCSASSDWTSFVAVGGSDEVCA